METLSLALDRSADPPGCHDFGYGLGPPTGVLVLRYDVAAGTLLTDRRDDLLHQLYYSPDAALLSSWEDTDEALAPGEAVWVRRGRSHRVLARSTGTAYRVCLRQRPSRLRALEAGRVTLDPDAVRHLVSLGTGAVRHGDWRAARRGLMAGLAPTDEPHPDPTRRLGTELDGAAAVASAITANPADGRSLADFADELHMSTRTLQRDFERRYGASFSRWRTGVRMLAAQELLKVLPVAEAGRRVGYRTASAFVAAFTRERGCTPGSVGRSASRG